MEGTDSRLSPPINLDQMRILQFFLLAFVFLSCTEYKNNDNKISKQLKLVNFIKIEIPYEFGFVSKSQSDGYLLAYSYVDALFYILNTEGHVLSNFKGRGEGPKEYSGILPFAGIHDKKVFFLDHQNLYLFSISGDFQSVTPYNDPLVSSFGGIPNSELFFLNDSSFIIPNVHIGDLAKRSDKIAILDTIPVWIRYNFSSKSQYFERAEVGLFDKNSPFFEGITFNNYRSHFILNEGSIIQIPIIGQDLFKYDLKLSNQIEKIKLNIPNFKFQSGLEEDRVTLDNYKLFNRMAEESSFISFVVNLNEKNLFLLYSVYETKNQNGDSISSKNSFKNQFFGFYFDLVTGQGTQIPLPHNGSDSFYKRVIYLGESKFLFVLENEIERDFHIGEIYKLVDIY